MSKTANQRCHECADRFHQRIAELKKQNESIVKYPIYSNGKANQKRTYCFGCGTTVKDQKYCHGCGKKLIWGEQALPAPVNAERSTENEHE